MAKDNKRVYYKTDELADTASRVVTELWLSATGGEYADAMRLHKRLLYRLSKQMKTSKELVTICLDDRGSPCAILRTAAKAARVDIPAEFSDWKMEILPWGIFLSSEDKLFRIRPHL